MKKRISAFTGITIVGLLLAGCTAKTNQSTTIPTSNLTRGAQIAKIPPEALKNALNSFAKAKSSSQNLSNGPCLGAIAPDWVLDIAHSPRTLTDNLPQNQCADYRNGKAHHFVEMDEKGQIIQAQ